MSLISCLRYQSQKPKTMFSSLLLLNVCFQFVTQKEIVNHSFAQHETVPFTETVIPQFTLRFLNVLNLNQL